MRVPDPFCIRRIRAQLSRDAQVCTNPWVPGPWGPWVLSGLTWVVVPSGGAKGWNGGLLDRSGAPAQVLAARVSRGEVEKRGDESASPTLHQEVQASTA